MSTRKKRSSGKPVGRPPKALAAMAEVPAWRPHDTLSALVRGLRPTRKLTVSEWADTYRYLGTEESSEPGKFRTNRIPYWRAVQDMLSPGSKVEQFYLMKGSQIGATQMVLNILGAHADLAPQPLLYAIPGDQQVKKAANGKFEPLIKNTPALRRKFSRRGAKEGTASMHEKQFHGGTLYIANAESVQTWRSTPIGFIVIDEFSGTSPDIGGEGDVITLAIGRQRTFPRRKLIALSTPTVQGTCPMAAAYEATSQMRVHVPCPHCGTFQTLEHDRLRYDPKDTDGTTYYDCHGCDEPILERHKTWMFRNYELRHTHPERASPRIVGLQVSALYSPMGWMSWADIAAMWERARGHSEKEKTFYNTVLGLPYAERTDVPEWEGLYNRREAYGPTTLPNGARLITCGVDVQGNRIEAEVLAHGQDGETWSVDYLVLAGKTDSAGPGTAWEALAKALTATYRRADGTEMHISKTCVDSGFNTNAVYAFCEKYAAQQVVPVKGMDKQAHPVSGGRAVDKSPDGTALSGVMLHTVGTEAMKSEVYGKLRTGLGDDGAPLPGYCHFPSHYDAHFFRMLTAEQLLRTMHRGYAQYHFTKTYTHNEALDTRSYALVAARLLGAHLWEAQDWLAVEAQLIGAAHPSAQPAQRPDAQRRSSYWGR